MKPPRIVHPLLAFLLAALVAVPACGDNGNGVTSDGNGPGEGFADVSSLVEAGNGFSLHPGFTIEAWADVPSARSLALGDNGTVFVGTRNNAVYAVRDMDGDGRGETVTVVDEGLNSPNGVALRGGDLYVAEISRVLRYDAIEANLDNPPEPVEVRSDYPTDEHHGWKFIAFGPDGNLYVPVGAPCNICWRDDNPIYASITRIPPDGSDRLIYARGVRNTVGFDWHPDTGELWFTDNGRDWLGDNRPPDELNHAPRAGMHFGYPFLHGSDTEDPEFYALKPDSISITPAARNLGPHVAALGMRFYTGTAFPAEYHKQVFIAEHGSWNRSEKIGYRVTLVRLEDGEPASYEVFASGWLRDGNVRGRPVDLLVMPDGSMLVSDDHGGRIWRIRYGE